MTNRRELLLGCGHSREKRIVPPGGTREWQDLVTLDNNPNVKPDILCDLDNFYEWGSGYAEYGTHRRIPEDSFDEVHAYEVLEHLGGQGSHRIFFHHFSEIWRILKPDGYLCATVPSRFSQALWGDPGHRRCINPSSLTFLDQNQYIMQCDREKPTSMSDYRNVYKADFELADCADNERTFWFVLRAVKPSRWKSKA